MRNDSEYELRLLTPKKIFDDANSVARAPRVELEITITGYTIPRWGNKRGKANAPPARLGAPFSSSKVLL